MNSLKSLFFLAVLAAAACGVYVSLNRSPESSIPPGVLPGGSDKPASPKVQMPTTPASPAPLGSAFAGPTRPSPAVGPPGMPPPPSPAPAGTGSVASDGFARAAPFSSVPPPPSGPPAADPPGNQRPSFDLRSDAMPRDTSAPPPTRDTASTQDAGASGRLTSLMKTVESKLSAGQVAEAHLLLSSLYDDPQVPPEQARQITRLLDQMAASVVYSRQHLLEQPYRVRPGDTLDRIAESYSVPPQLLAKINGIRDPRNLTPGRELKVVRGPFSALIDLNRRELTLMVQGRYAGRFPIDLGHDAAVAPGTYMVRDKKDDRATGRDSIAGYAGSFWISLGGPVAISDRNRGSVALGDRDLEDVFGILSVGSRVVIQR